MKKKLLTFIISFLTSYSYSQIITLDKNINDTLRNDDIIRISKEIESDVEITFNNSNKKKYKISDLIKSNADFKGINIKNDTLIISKEKYKLSHLDKIRISVTSQKIVGDFIFKDVSNVAKLPTVHPSKSAKEVTTHRTKILFKDGDNVLNDAKILINRDILDVNRKVSILKIYNASIENPFLKKTTLNSANQSSDGVGKMGSNIAKTDVTNIASGMARFLAERAKAELNESFFFYMHSQMEKVPELQFYFPQSYTVLKEIKKQNGNLNLEQLKTYFEQDIHKLPKNFYLTTQQKNFPVGSHLYTINNYLKNDANGQWIDYGLQVVFENDGKINPKELLYGFVHSDARKNLEGKLTEESDKNLLNTIKLAELVSNSLLSPETNRYWVSQENINELLSNEALFQTYIGLLLAKSNFDEYKITFNGTDLKTIIEGKYTTNGTIEDLKNLKNLIKGLYNSYADVDKAVAEITENKNNFNAENLYRVYNVLNDNISVITTQINDNKILRSTISVDDSYFKNYIKPAIDIAYNMSSKKYNVAIKGFINLLENSVNNEQLEFIKSLADNFDNIDNFKNAPFTKSLVIKYFSNEDNIKQLNNILGTDAPKYFQFITNQEKLNQFNTFNLFVNKIDADEINIFITFLKSQKFDSIKNIQNKEEINTQNIDYVKKYLNENINIESIKDFIKFIKSIDSVKLESLHSFINNKDNHIESLIYISQNYYTKDSKSNLTELLITEYLKDPDCIKNTIKIIQSNPEVRNHFHKHVKKYSKDYNNFMSKFATYGILIANVSMAQNSDEVKDAITASVLPVGSSRMKRHADWSITLNAYVGGFAGRAYFKDYNGTSYENKSIATFGVTAPIGISFNKGRMPFFGSKSTMGLTLQVVDLGSLVNFYAQKGDGAALPRDTKIELGDIIAPGGFLSYSIGDTPFTLMGGVQYVPNLSRMETIPTNAEFKPLTWRFHVGIAIDIPLFNLKVWN